MSDLEQTRAYRAPLVVQMGRAFLAVVLGLLLQLPCAVQELNPQLVMETSLGSVRLELFADKAPLSVKNYLQYVDAQFYDGLVFHRVIGNFMIQGGGLGQDLKEKPGRPPIANEAGNGLSNVRGTLAIAHQRPRQHYLAVFYQPQGQ